MTRGSAYFWSRFCLVSSVRVSRAEWNMFCHWLREWENVLDNTRVRDAADALPAGNGRGVLPQEQGKGAVGCRDRV